MHSLVKNSFNRSYNPTSSGKNALSHIKRLLTSRDTGAQTNACGLLCEVINRYDKDSTERAKLIQSLLSNDITLFLCEAMSNLEWSLFRNILKCLRLLCSSRSFFEDEHDAHSSSAIVRALVYYAGSGLHGAIECSLEFLCDMLAGIRDHGFTSPLSCDSAYSTEQLLACLNSITSKCAFKTSTTIASTLVLQSLISYQPDSLKIRASTAIALASTFEHWFTYLLGTLNQASLLGDDEEALRMYYVLICQLGIDVLRLTNVIRESKRSNDFIQSIINDEQEVTNLLQCAIDLDKYVLRILHELVNFTKENHGQLPTEEYGVYLIFLHTFLKESKDVKIVVQFSDFLFANNYLSFLPQAHIERQDIAVKKVSTLVLGEILCSLAKKYLGIDDESSDSQSCDKDIQMGLLELQYGIERPQNLGQQLQKCQSYALVIYLYFYCQSTKNPQEAMGQLLPHLVKHILCLPITFNPPNYIVKCLWLVFAMSSITNTSLKSLTERVYLEKATDKFVGLLQGNPSAFYSHNPAILLWVFISSRIPLHFRISVVSLWFELEDSLPVELTTQPVVWDVLLYILKQNANQTIVQNVTKSLKNSLEQVDVDIRQNLASILWSSLPDMLSQVLIDMDKETNARHILDLATMLTPEEVDQNTCCKIAVLICSIFSKSSISDHTGEEKLHYVYTCLKLCLYLLALAKINEDQRVLVTYVNRTKFLISVLRATYSVDDRVACVALQLLSCILHYHTGHTQPKTIVQVQSCSIVSCLKQNICNERGAALLQFIYMILNSGATSPLALSISTKEVVDDSQPYTALRGLMFRIQMMCCKESPEQSSAGWKTLSAIFRYGIMTKLDTKLVTILTTQPWTHMLIQFQISQHISKEFLLFTYTWIKFMKIIIEKQTKPSYFGLYKHTLMYKTLMLLKNNLTNEGDNTELQNDILEVVKSIFSVNK